MAEDVLGGNFKKIDPGSTGTISDGYYALKVLGPAGSSATLTIVTSDANSDDLSDWELAAGSTVECRSGMDSIQKTAGDAGVIAYVK